MIFRIPSHIRGRADMQKRLSESRKWQGQRATNPVLPYRDRGRQGGCDGGKYDHRRGARRPWLHTPNIAGILCVGSRGPRHLTCIPRISCLAGCGASNTSHMIRSTVASAARLFPMVESGHRSRSLAALAAVLTWTFRTILSYRQVTPVLL